MRIKYCHGHLFIVVHILKLCETSSQTSCLYISSWNEFEISRVKHGFASRCEGNQFSWSLLSLFDIGVCIVFIG